MARLTLDPAQRPDRPGPVTRLVLAATGRVLGQVPDSMAAMSVHPGVLRRWGAFEAANARMPSSVLPGELRDLVVLVASVRLGCSWCVDFGAALWERRGLDQQTLVEAVRWRTSDVFDEPTRAVLEYTEAVCADPVAVTDELADRVRSHHGERGLVEVTYWAALENLRSRFNAALGLTSQGFSSGAACSLPVPEPAEGTATRAGG
ncbi:carboxymuconolactone decarboxylase family protein [Thalassiella azotivora]